MLPDYLEHIRRYPSTLLPRFYGLFTVTTPSESRYDVVLMSSVFGNGLAIHEKYDLKGSVTGREASASELASPDPILKDLDLKRHIYLGKTTRSLLLGQLGVDLRLLSEHDLMDYSLLIGVHRLSLSNTLDGPPSFGLGPSLRPQKPRQKPSPWRIATVPLQKAWAHTITKMVHRFVYPIANDAQRRIRQAMAPQAPTTDPRRRDPLDDADDMYGPRENDMFRGYQGGTASTGILRDEVYVVGLIDVLQEYNLRKKMETVAKGMTQPRSHISAVDPKLYAERLIGFVSRITE
jgi:1-phosphatidylinositol-4-phosphate 5-kinase